MTRIQSLSRRAMVRLTLMAVTATGILGSSRRQPRPGVVSDPLAHRLAAISLPSASARTIGCAALDALPGPVHVDQLIAHLGKADELRRLNPNALRRAVRERHRRDLENDDIVNVRGWILSRAEASLCALTALVARDGRG